MEHGYKGWFKFIGPCQGREENLKSCLTAEFSLQSCPNWKPGQRARAAASLILQPQLQRLPSGSQPEALPSADPNPWLQLARELSWRFCLIQVPSRRAIPAMEAVLQTCCGTEAHSGSPHPTAESSFSPAGPGDLTRRPENLGSQ